MVKFSYQVPREIFSYWRLLVKAKQRPDVIVLSGFSSKIFLTPLDYFYGIPVVWFEFGQKIKVLVKRLNLNDKVVFKGWVELVPAEMLKADICVFPSVWPLEGFGMV